MVRRRQGLVELHTIRRAVERDSNVRIWTVETQTKKVITTRIRKRANGEDETHGSQQNDILLAVNRMLFCIEQLLSRVGPN
jgi:hypothetical protein